ncbi:class F sortase [Microbacterium sp. P05]|uniref:class F sortase n=1 Tax=Microbacterium sp. P05 TaxID=3366948 RepID=UPI0037460A03
MRSPSVSASIAALLVGAAMLAGCSAPPTETASVLPSSPASASPTATSPPSLAPQPAVTPLERGLAPVSVSIERIGLTEPLIDLGLTPEGRMEVPADYADVGWYTPGGRPGGHGPLVIAAHVDSPTGPAVFIRLSELAPGDHVEVTDTAGTVHRYRVSEVADYPKAQFPTARVFGAVLSDELRLITCGGVFDTVAGSYEDNRVVFAVRDDVP